MKRLLDRILKETWNFGSRCKIKTLYRPRPPSSSSDKNNTLGVEAQNEENNTENVSSNSFMFWFILLLLILSVKVPYGVYQTASYIVEEDECACFDEGLLNYLFRPPKPVGWLATMKVFIINIHYKFWF